MKARTVALLQVALTLQVAAVPDRLGAGAGVDDEAVVDSAPTIDKWPSDPSLDTRDSEADSSETQMMAAGAGGGAAAAMGNHGKFFQYGHHDGKDHYEFGYRRGNDHHFQERHEKAAPKHGHFHTKVRWGDKHGGYGEHYWDYNHQGKDDGDGGGEGSAPVPEYSAASTDQEEDSRSHHKRQSQSSDGDAEAAEEDAKHRNMQRARGGGSDPAPGPRSAASSPSQQSAPTPTPTPTRKPAGLGFGTLRHKHKPQAQPFSSDHMFPASTGGFLGRREDFAARTARQVAGGTGQSGSGLRRLVFNTHSGLVRDQDTGKVYALQPVT